MAKWWGPRYFTNPVCEIDAKVGGAILIHMLGPDGVLYPMKGVFREVVKPERLVFTASAFDDENGNLRLENLTTVTFAEHEGEDGVDCALRRNKGGAWNGSSPCGHGSGLEPEPR